MKLSLKGEYLRRKMERELKARATEPEYTDLGYRELEELLTKHEGVSCATSEKDENK